MNIKEAKEWIAAFKKAKFKCIVPEQVTEAFRILEQVKVAKSVKAGV
jgi:hypothetical protein